MNPSLSDVMMQMQMIFDNLLAKAFQHLILGKNIGTLRL